ncbi:MAG: M20/M25/M40 family metallo-hydrolase, partial [Mycoplasmatales bacterium]
KLKCQFPTSVIDYEISKQYLNMADIVSQRPEIVDIAKEAMKKASVAPLVEPIRGGTDGSNLSFIGLPCPNIFTGGHNFHGRFEYVCVDSMLKAVDVIVNIINEVSEN